MRSSSCSRTATTAMMSRCWRRSPRRCVCRQWASRSPIPAMWSRWVLPQVLLGAADGYTSVETLLRRSQILRPLAALHPTGCRVMPPLASFRAFWRLCVLPPWVLGCGRRNPAQVSQPGGMLR